MQRITIHITVPKSAAMAAGAALYGDTTFEPSEDQIAQLSTLEAAALLAYEGTEAKEKLPILGYAPDLWPYIKSALAKAAAERVERILLNAERARARIELFDWAVEQDLMPALCEAAKRDYDISTRYVFELAKLIAGVDLQLIGLAPPIITCAEQLEKNATHETRPSPSLYALTLESRLQLEVVQLLHDPIDKKPAVAPGTVVKIESISRLMPNHGDPQTVMMVRVSHPATGYGATVIWSAEDHRELVGAVQELRDPGPEA